MFHIPYTHRHQEQIPGRNTTRRQKNPGFIIHGISVKKKIGTTKRSKILHGIVKASTLDVYAYFRTHLCSDLTLDAPGKKTYPTAATVGLQISGPSH